MNTHSLVSLISLVRARKLIGSPRIPGDKSISHRALILGALAKGRTRVHGLLESADVLSTAKCLSQLGVRITSSDRGEIQIEGIGGSGFQSPNQDLDCGNSGTTMRLLMGMLSAQKNLRTSLIGDASLNGRPMKRVAGPLRAMGANIILDRENYAPVKIHGQKLSGVQYSLEIASAQIKSALILAALSAEGSTVLSGQIGSRDHTERMLESFGVKLDVTPDRIVIPGGSELSSASITVPGDPSTAAFWIAAACISNSAESKITLEKISLNPTRTGFINVMRRMGARIEARLDSGGLQEGVQGEPIGKITARSSDLVGVRVFPAEVPSLIDEIPLLGIVATQARGITEVRGAEELRVKESDRIEALAQGLRAMGAEIETRPDGFVIEGPQKLSGARIKSLGDHRIAMAFSIAALVADGETQIEEPECVSVSYPGFFKDLEALTKHA
jgi:3-phosphoshikimate 1-carboxyvinyltransferase